MSDIIEYYDGEYFMWSVESSMVPLVGQKISIRQQTWTVVGVTFALDHANEIHEKRMRCNVDLQRVKP